MRFLTLLPLCTIACAETTSERLASRVHETGSMTLELQSREGDATTGWSFDSHETVDLADADLYLSSWDCGARGRWVELHGQDVELGIREDTADAEYLGIGGSDFEVEIGGTFYVEHADGSVTPMVLRDRTDTPADWYTADDLSFSVVLELAD